MNKQTNIMQEVLICLKKIFVAYLAAIFHFFISPPRKSVEDEIVLITGSGHGMGRQLAVEFAKLGARLVLWDTDQEGNEVTRKLIADLGGKCHTYICDVSQRGEVYRVGQLVKEEVGDVSILVNNAGVVTGKALVDSPDEMIERTFQVNLLSHFWTVKCFLPAMLSRNHGHIVNMSSSVGLIGVNKLTDYSASKFGVVGFTEVLNYEIYFSGHDGVHTTLVCPSFTQTGMFEGCDMRYPSVLPPLKTKETVDRIMKGILTNQQQICIPRLVYIVAVLKTMFPVDAMVEIIRFFGADSFMNTFVGRRPAT